MILIRYLTLFLFTLVLMGCDKPQPTEPKQMLVYCGITMIKPMKKLADEFEKQHPVKVTLIQGGSQDLYESLKMSKKGDIYFPGSANYRINNEKEGLLTDHVLVGYNRVAMMVQKGNPKKLSASLTHFNDPTLNTVLSNPQTGSIGKAAFQVLQQQGIAEEAYKNTLYLTTDSRRLMEAIKTKKADLILNWYATATWPSNKDFVDIIELPKDIAKPKALELNLTRYSKNPTLAKAFMDFAVSPNGLQVFKEYGFLTDEEYSTLLSKQ